MTILDRVDEAHDRRPLVREDDRDAHDLGVGGHPPRDFVEGQPDQVTLEVPQEAVGRFGDGVDDGHLLPRGVERAGHVGEPERRRDRRRRETEGLDCRGPNEAHRPTSAGWSHASPLHPAPPPIPAAGHHPTCAALAGPAELDKRLAALGGGLSDRVQVPDADGSGRPGLSFPIRRYASSGTASMSL